MEGGGDPGEVVVFGAGEAAVGFSVGGENLELHEGSVLDGGARFGVADCGHDVARPVLFGGSEDSLFGQEQCIRAGEDDDFSECGAERPDEQESTDEDEEGDKEQGHDTVFGHVSERHREEDPGEGVPEEGEEGKETHEGGAQAGTGHEEGEGVRGAAADDAGGGRGFEGLVLGGGGAGCGEGCGAGCGCGVEGDGAATAGEFGDEAFGEGLEEFGAVVGGEGEAAARGLHGGKGDDGGSGCVHGIAAGGGGDGEFAELVEWEFASEGDGADAVDDVQVVGGEGDDGGAWEEDGEADDGEKGANEEEGDAEEGEGVEEDGGCGAGGRWGGGVACGGGWCRAAVPAGRAGVGRGLLAGGLDVGGVLVMGHGDGVGYPKEGEAREEESEEEKGEAGETRGTADGGGEGEAEFRPFIEHFHFIGLRKQSHENRPCQGPGRCGYQSRSERQRVGGRSSRWSQMAAVAPVPMATESWVWAWATTSPAA